MSHILWCLYRDFGGVMTFCECAVRCLCMQVLCRGGKTYRLSVVNFVECVVCGLCLLCVLAVR